ncbi:arsenic resistance N-acetyltransferase ArsN2 [Chryseosolibacter indicus]|uniref:GNAT family N-acetyltransferase n=1 Tax=Chryseosolibacter indicus TaxID=2782351 RepID=A0ABS5VJQ8_9BACT|nr:arsenic resistance N-acetyltransferase ArsN2 [Chryseosolibacter indicus]MBT1701673.1 GNAT family N-acetyltransferase [Chryseosolibacter indicus]
MQLVYKIINDEKSFEEFRTLLKSSSLPADDLNFKKDLLVGYYEGDSLVGTGALEIYSPYALLRSLSVKLGIRGKSVGSTITEYLMNEANKRKLKAIYLLTETAQGFFSKKGFTSINRDEVPSEVKVSSEFSHVCPASAIAMVYNC